MLLLIRRVFCFRLAFLMMIIMWQILVINWSEVFANRRTSRLQFDKISAGMPEEVVKDLLGNGFVTLGGYDSDKEFQRASRENKDYGGVMFIGDMPPIPHSQIYVSFQGKRLVFKALWEPTFIDFVERQYGIFKWRLGP